MPRRLLKTSLAALALAAALAGPGGVAQAQNASPEAGGPGPQPRLVRVASDEAGGFITGLGTARCRQSLELGFDATGQISAVTVEEGQAVKKGQVLARLDERMVAAELKAKEAEASAAAAEVERAAARHQEKQKLHQGRAATLNDVREAGFELAKARARLEAAQAEAAALNARLAGMVLKAPVAGVIAKRISEPGEVVTPNGKRVLRLIDCALILAEVEFGERLYTRIAPGQEVTLVADALPGRRFTGKVHAISPEVDEKNRTFTVKVAVDNPEFMLKPGMFVRAALAPAAAGPASLWLPPEALGQVDGDLATITVIVERRPVQRRVRLGRREPGRVEIVEGVAAGETVALPPAPAPGGGRP
ncbi:MAG: efflux RND transporter periplasmic adaptor subunit [Thermodesulfobacteriota bacterium]